MKLYDLRTEYRENPIGLTDKAPNRVRRAEYNPDSI